MNSLKKQPFVSALAAITFVICAALFFLVFRGSGKYDDAKAAFDESYAAVTVSERIPLYPTGPNRNGKNKSLSEYRDSIEELRNMFEKFRPDSLDVVEPQVFTTRIKDANALVTEAFKSSQTEMPDGFFLGFEEYIQKLASKDATGVLGYQLDGIKHALLGLATARPTQILQIHRESIPEERGISYQPNPEDVTRNLAFEISFRGPETTARDFINHLGDTAEYYYVIRCISIANERMTPPKVGDVQFETRTPAPPSTPADIFNDFEFQPGAESDPEVPSPEVVEVAPDEGAPKAEKLLDSTRLLSQVLGSEDITVFVRIDLSMLLPFAELPKP